MSGLVFTPFSQPTTTNNKDQNQDKTPVVLALAYSLFQLCFHSVYKNKTKITAMPKLKNDDPGMPPGTVPVYDISCTDVVMGRGSGTQNHCGNVTYRKLVFLNKVRLF